MEVGKIRRPAFASSLLAQTTLNDIADVYRLRTVGAGVDQRLKGRERWPDDYTVHLSDEPISVSFSRQQPEESIQGGQPRLKGDWRLRFRTGRDIDSKDVIKVTTLNNRVFNIIGLLNGTDEVMRIAEASEIV